MIGGAMFRRLSLLVGLVAAFHLCTAVRGQDSPSLGDVARQLRKDKGDAAPKKVITNDDLPANAGSSAGGLGAIGDPKGLSKSGDPESPEAAIGKMETAMKMLDAMDRPTLVKAALQGTNPDFPGRRAWEDKLWEAKQAYVARGKELSQEARQILSTSQSLQASQPGQTLKPDDPKVQDLTRRLKQFMQDAMRADSNFRAVMMEGLDLAKQTPAH
jgi:hypothetical protein